MACRHVNESILKVIRPPNLAMSSLCGCESYVQTPTFKPQQEIIEEIHPEVMMRHVSRTGFSCLLLFFCYCDVKGWSRVMHGGHEKEGKFLPPTFIYTWSHGHGQSEEVGSWSEEAQDRSSGWITAPNQAKCTSKGDVEDEAEDDANKLGPGNDVLDLKHLSSALRNTETRQSLTIKAGGQCRGPSVLPQGQQDLLLMDTNRNS